MIFDVSEVESIIGYTFNNKMLLRKCFTHSSYANEHSCDDNELLEFFGDSIIEFIVTEYLFNNYAGDEGRLTLLRAEIVSKKPLLKYVYKTGLDKFMLLGNGQAKSGILEEKLYSSLYEAIVAGIYIDSGGIKDVKDFIINTIVKDFDIKMPLKENKGADAKTEFQEYVQKHKIGRINYETLSKKGPDHLPVFRVAVTLNNVRIAEGEGTTKKSAEAQAAGKALKKIQSKKQ